MKKIIIAMVLITVVLAGAFTVEIDIQAGAAFPVFNGKTGDYEYSWDTAAADGSSIEPGSDDWSTMEGTSFNTTAVFGFGWDTKPFASLRAGNYSKKVNTVSGPYQAFPLNGLSNKTSINFNLGLDLGLLFTIVEKNRINLQAGPYIGIDFGVIENTWVNSFDENCKRTTTMWKPSLGGDIQFKFSITNSLYLIAGMQLAFSTVYEKAKVDVVFSHGNIENLETRSINLTTIGVTTIPKVALGYKL